MNANKLLIATLLSGGAFATALFAAPALAADVSVSIGQPGFYGRIDIGGAPQPRTVYRQPVVVERVQVEEEPIYLRVPPGHARHWRDHCREYDACGRRVYFVRDDWYNDVYAPQYREHHGEGHGDDHQGDQGGDGDRGKHHHHKNDDRHDDHRDNGDRGGDGHR
jgi:hypothetical protein